ncbi:MAG TPA: tRNA (N(6)-L-threonylcarbamoyladenosine(37)-C(2))-methylthiotransferase MtaB [Terriglobia bacterium]|nr:tRNA (N(6)-L-threonylcarbamoyladenosine(37)-C(2))-methylthiotransferase MtaB [Terriglobia bacterium]
MTTFCVLNFGCRASYADGVALRSQLLEAGLEEASRGEPSDLAVLNTCTVTSTADAEVRQVIRRIHRSNPRCQILVTGCYAQRAPGEIAELPGVTWVVGNSHKHAVAELVKTHFGQDSGRAASHTPAGADGRASDALEAIPQPEFVQIVGQAQVLVGEISREFHFTQTLFGGTAKRGGDERTRPNLKVQDGCNARCSFCVIPQVRGDSRSLPPDRAVAQVREFARQGYKEVVLSGINLGSYGRDLDRKVTFLGLLEKILAETSIPRLRISSIEPMDVSAELIRLVASEPRLARHFHVPLQSGSDRILRLMNRRYWTTQYAERLRAIRERVPHCAIGADVMVGFPGETGEDHARTLAFLEAMPLTYVHVFPYSLRPNTAAATLSGHINGRIAHERGQEIRAFVARKHQAFLDAQMGRTLSAVTLDQTKDSARIALSSNFLQVALPGSELPPNTLLDVHIGRVADGLLYGRPEESRAPSAEAQPLCARA